MYSTDASLCPFPLQCGSKGQSLLFPKKALIIFVSLISYAALEKSMASQIIHHMNESGVQCEFQFPIWVYKVPWMFIVYILVIFDFPKAFYMVHFEIMIKNPKFQLGVSNDAAKVICSYLPDRTCRIFSGHTVSELISLSSGVPEGSILDPLLFSLYTNDIEKCFKHMNHQCYADATQM